MPIFDNCVYCAEQLHKWRKLVVCEIKDIRVNNFLVWVIA